MTGQQFVNAALELLCVIPAGGDPTSADATTALGAANRMRKSWNAQSLAVHVIARTPYTWTANQSSRTIGPSSANFSYSPAPPQAILAAKVLPVGATSEQHVHVMTHAEYAAIPDKTQTADYMSHLLYEPDAPNGTLIVWPVPTSAPSLIIHAKSLLAAITLDSEIDVPESYEEPLVYQLAKRLQTPFGARLSGDDLQIADESFAVLKRANIRIPEPVRLPAELRGRRGFISSADYDSGNF